MKDRRESNRQRPLTRPSADLSPQGRGEEDRIFSLSRETTTAYRPRPNGERVGVRGLGGGVRRVVSFSNL